MCRRVLVRRTKASCGIQLPPKLYHNHELVYKPLEMGMSVTLTLTLNRDGSLLPVSDHMVRVTALRQGGAEGQGEAELGVLRLPASEPLRREIGLLGEEHWIRFAVHDGAGRLVAQKELQVPELCRRAVELQNRSLLDLATAAAEQSAAATGKDEEISFVADQVEAKRAAIARSEDAFRLGAGLEVHAEVACDVLPHGYLQHEKDFLMILPRYSAARQAAQTRGGDFHVRQALRKEEDTLLKVLMAKVTNMKMALCHPVLSGKGREVSILFSSRASAGKVKFCAVCHPTGLNLPFDDSDGDLAHDREEEIERQEAQQRNGAGSRNDGDGADEDENPLKHALRRKCKEDDKGGPLIALPECLCAKARGGDNGHWAHEECVRKLEEEMRCQPVADDDSTDEDGVSNARASPPAASVKAEGSTGSRPACPRCCHLLDGLGLMRGAAFDANLDERISESTKLWDEETDSGGWHLMPKFRKLQQLVRDGMPTADKLLLFSSFLGSLDFSANMLRLEGSVTERFDGEVKDKTGTLERARQPSVKALLSTIRSGGVGLNLQEFNQVAFLDRDLNPQKHRQAEDRTYRIGQTKEVHVHYLDGKDTFDEATRALFEGKLENAEAILDHALGSEASYKDLIGIMGEVLRKIIARRAGMSREELMLLTNVKPLDKKTASAAKRSPNEPAAVGASSMADSQSKAARPTPARPDTASLAKWAANRAPPPPPMPPPAPLASQPCGGPGSSTGNSGGCGGRSSKGKSSSKAAQAAEVRIAAGIAAASTNRSSLLPLGARPPTHGNVRGTPGVPPPPKSPLSGGRADAGSLLSHRPAAQQSRPWSTPTLYVDLDPEPAAVTRPTEGITTPAATPNSLAPERQVRRRLKEAGVDKGRFAPTEIESALSTSGGNVDAAVRALRFLV